jgi:hypothetical protein
MNTLVDDKDNTRSTCLVYAAIYGQSLADLYDKSTYTNEAITPSEFFTKLNDMSLKQQGQNNMCGTNQILGEFNRRVNNVPALLGLAANIGGQLTRWSKSQVYKSV